MRKFLFKWPGRLCRNSTADGFWSLLIQCRSFAPSFRPASSLQHFRASIKAIVCGTCLFQGKAGGACSGRPAPTSAMAKVKQWAVIFGNSNLIKNITEESTFYFANATFCCTLRTARVLSLCSSQVIKKSF